MQMREYKYQDQIFELLAKDCYVEVWLDDEVRYVGAATNCTNEMPYGVSANLTNGRRGWTPFNGNRTLTDGINSACHQLLRSKAEKSLDFQSVCKRMYEEFEKLP